ncbi:helix-turn-helix domain-containing protein [Lactococcus petauri]|uniref:helix-turn-helix domain-containing protein n=1 Tax=Lactococcus petauri TaxID=1940789 RepID=UPI00254A2FCA|nr:helix-turn-helix transcriptional regulator [Lactococcus petauri]
MDFYNRIKKLSKEQKKSFNKIERDLGYPRNTLYNYKTKEPSEERLRALSRYFGVSEDYLSGKIEFNSDKTLSHYDNEIDVLFDDFKEKFEDIIYGIELKEFDKIYQTEDVLNYFSNLQEWVAEEVDELDIIINTYKKRVENRKNKEKSKTVIED